jgi:hypothetical protein
VLDTNTSKCSPALFPSGLEWHFAAVIESHTYIRNAALSVAAVLRQEKISNAITTIYTKPRRDTTVLLWIASMRDWGRGMGLRGRIIGHAICVVDMVREVAWVAVANDDSSCRSCRCLGFMILFAEDFVRDRNRLMIKWYVGDLPFAFDVCSYFYSDILKVTSRDASLPISHFCTSADLLWQITPPCIYIPLTSP